MAKSISMALTLKPKYGYHHLSALMQLPVPCISGFSALICPRSSIQGLNSPRALPIQGLRTLPSPLNLPLYRQCIVPVPRYGIFREDTRYKDPSSCLQYPIFRERTNSFKTGRGVVHVHWYYTA